MLSTHHFIITRTVTRCAEPVAACDKNQPVESTFPNEELWYSKVHNPSFHIVGIELLGIVTGLFKSQYSMERIHEFYRIYVQGQRLSRACARKQPQGRDFDSACQDN